MALSKELLQSLSEIEQETKRFEVALRTSFTTKNPNNHIVIQRVNNQCAALKKKVQELAKAVMANDYCRARSALESATFYIGKYEQVIER